MADRLLALAAVLDGLDRRPRIRMRHAPHETAQRLLDSLGVLVFIDLSASPCAQRCNQKECRMTTIAFEPNWISYRHSLVQVDKRRDADDDTLEICAHCECEVDVDPAPHSPLCKAPAQVAIREGRDPGAPTPTRKVVDANEQRREQIRAQARADVEGLDLLEAMDAGEPLPPAHDDDDELELDEEAAAERLGPDGDASSSSPVLEDERAVAVGHAAVSGSAASSGEPERAAANSTDENPYGLQRFGRGYKWPNDIALRAVRDFAATVGRPPQQQDTRDEPVGTLPSEGTAIKQFGSWDDMIRAADLKPAKPRSARGPRAKQSKREPQADGHALEAAAPPNPRATPSTSAKPPAAATPSRSDLQAAAAAPPEPESRDDHERGERVVDASPPAAPPTAPASGPGSQLATREAPPGTITIPTPLTRLLAKIPMHELEQAIDEYDVAIAQLQKELAFVEHARATQREAA